MEQVEEAEDSLKLALRWWRRQKRRGGVKGESQEERTSGRGIGAIMWGHGMCACGMGDGLLLAAKRVSCGLLLESERVEKMRGMKGTRCEFVSDGAAGGTGHVVTA
eukprot:664699-Prorocentrum_minimum.AAC.4